MTPEMLAVRQRLYDDFSFYAPSVLKIRTKNQKVEPFALNESQRRLLAEIERQMVTTGRVRIIVLKGRQMGISTFIGGWLYYFVSQRKAQRCVVVAHKADATRNLLDMTHRYHRLAPDIMRPQTRFVSRSELNFSNLDSSYTVATAGGDGIGRSDTITCAHLSELAFWPESSAQESFSGLMDTIPSEDGTAVFIESTAQGVTGVFHDQWEAATEGKSAFIPVFLPWFIEPAYRVTPAADFEKTPQETDLAEKYGLDDAQLCYRRQRIAEKGEDLFRQEYPCCPEEAFLTSGRPVFRPDQVNEFLINSPKPIKRQGLEGGKWVDHPHGELFVYREFDPGEHYFIGADVGGGVQRDFSCAQVLDSHGRQVATYRAQIEPDPYADILLALGYHYGTAQMIVERNNHGILPCQRIYHDFSYPNFYVETTTDKKLEREVTTIGFYTSTKSKPLIIDELRANLRSGLVHVYDKQTIEEMRSYVVRENGQMEAEKGKHDDTVIALALANHINTGPVVPVVNQPSWYLTLA